MYSNQLVPEHAFGPELEHHALIESIGFEDELLFPARHIPLHRHCRRLNILQLHRHVRVELIWKIEDYLQF